MAARTQRIWLLVTAMVVAALAGVVVALNAGHTSSHTTPEVSSSASAPKTASPSVPFPQISNPTVWSNMSSFMQSCFVHTCLGSPTT